MKFSPKVKRDLINRYSDKKRVMNILENHSERVIRWMTSQRRSANANSLSKAAPLKKYQQKTRLDYAYIISKYINLGGDI